ncbi:MAG TPA: chemotaxis protein CheW [Stellaceae bacterium]|jgi:purine-binding chemotaxis protein CheW|nr:chemotaxis protein CheW [Stellaceae bacterium]
MSKDTDPRGKAGSAGDQHEFVSITVAEQLFGIPVLQVQDVLGPQRITRIPLAPAEVAGSLNLRGRIVTAIDLRTRLRLPPLAEGQRGMSVVVDHGGELYSIIVDAVGEVLALDTATAERNPATLNPVWRDVSAGIYRLDKTLLIVLDVARVLDFTARAEAA